MFSGARSRFVGSARFYQAGVALWQVLVGLGAVIALLGLVFSLTSDRAQSEEVSAEVSNLNRLSASLLKGYPAENFASLSIPDAISKQLIPAQMFRGGQSIRSAWGTPIELAPHTVLAPADGFVVTYRGVPAEACRQLGLAMAGHVYELKASGRTLLAPDGFSPAQAEQHCDRSEGATMEFFFHPQLIPQTGLRQ